MKKLFVAVVFCAASSGSVAAESGDPSAGLLRLAHGVMIKH